MVEDGEEFVFLDELHDALGHGGEEVLGDEAECQFSFVGEYVEHEEVAFVDLADRQYGNYHFFVHVIHALKGTSGQELLE